MKQLSVLAQRWPSASTTVRVAALAALLLAAFEWVSVSLTIRLTSDALSLASFAASLIAGYFVCALIGVPLASGLQRLATWARLDRVLAIRLVVAAMLCALGLHLFDLWSAQFYWEEFPDRVAWAKATVRAAIVGGVTFAVELGWRWLTPRVDRLVPLLRVVFWSFVIGICFWLSGYTLVAVHLTPFVGPFAVLAVLAACWLLRGSSFALSRAYPIAGVVLALTLLAPFSVFRNRYARSMTFGHCPIAASLFGPLRDLLDLDNDGSAPPWAGGDDCAEFNPKVSPLQIELPADGIDQDCRGGDAPAIGPDPALVDREQLLSQLGGCELPPPPISIILITIDALRADVVSPAVTPSLVRFAMGSLDFRRAYSPSTMTRRAVPSIFSGRTVSDFKAPNVYRQIDLNMGTSWSTILAKAGYYTAGYSFLTVPDAVSNAFHHFNKKHLDDYQADRGKYLIASATTTSAVLSLFEQGVRSPFFVWVHYPDMHAPYLNTTSAPQLPAELQGYEREAAYTDLHVGRLLGAFEAAGVLANTIVAISADHGEELGQRGIEGHGPFAFESVLHVPLIVRIPGCAPRQLDHPVGTVDLLPNLGVLVGAAGRARSLAATGEQARAVVSELWDVPDIFLRVVVDSDLKMIADVRNGGRLLFNLASDPMESQDLYRSRPDLAERLERRYQRWLDNPGNR